MNHYDVLEEFAPHIASDPLPQRSLTAEEERLIERLARSRGQPSAIACFLMVHEELRREERMAINGVVLQRDESPTYS